MEFDLTKVKFSICDIKRDIRLSKEMSKELAELIGIITGDGHVGIYKKCDGRNKHPIVICGHKTEDLDYYRDYLNNLFKKLFNVELKLRFSNQENTLYATIDSMCIAYFFYYSVGLPIGNKVSRTTIPKCIQESETEIKTAFIRGLADTDSSISFKKGSREMNCYPTISIKQKSKQIIEDLSEALSVLGFTMCTEYDIIDNDKRGFTSIGHRIYISGKPNLEKWMNMIGFSNPKHLTKYFVWKKYGYCKPYSTLEERKFLLKEMSPEGFEPTTVPVI